MHEIQHVPHRSWRSRRIERYVCLLTTIRTSNHLVGGRGGGFARFSASPECPPMGSTDPMPPRVNVSVQLFRVCSMCVSWYKSDCDGKARQHRAKSRCITQNSRGRCDSGPLGASVAHRRNRKESRRGFSKGIFEEKRVIERRKELSKRNPSENGWLDKFRSDCDRTDDRDHGIRSDSV